MGIAAYNRGSRLASREADGRMPLVIRRAERLAYREEAARLREHISRLERDLSRARRCLGAERNAREQLRLRLVAEVSSHAFTTAILCSKLDAEQAMRDRVTKCQAETLRPEQIVGAA